MKRALVFCCALLFALSSQAAPPSNYVTNGPPVPAGWLQMSTRELAFSIHQEAVQPSCRQEASEFVLFLMRELRRADYNIHLSAPFLDEEINYYQLNLTQEKPLDLSRAILACLQTARQSGAIDWNCLRNVQRDFQDPFTFNRHFPWMDPPGDAGRVRLRASADTALPELQLTTRWILLTNIHAVVASSSIQDNYGQVVRDGSAVFGKSAIWGFDATLRLQSGSQVLFEKFYPHESWQPSHANFLHMPPQQISSDYARARPHQMTSLKVLEDIRAGLRPKPELPADPKGKKKKVAKVTK